MDKEETLKLLELMRECRDELDSTLYTNIHGPAGYDKVRDLMLRMYKMEKTIREAYDLPEEVTHDK